MKAVSFFSTLSVQLFWVWMGEAGWVDDEDWLLIFMGICFFVGIVLMASSAPTRKKIGWGLVFGSVASFAVVVVIFVSFWSNFTQ